MLFNMETRAKGEEGIKMNYNQNQYWWLHAQENGESLLPHRIIKDSCDNCGATWTYLSPIPKVAPGTVLYIHKCR